MAADGTGDFEFSIVKNLTFLLLKNRNDNEALYDFVNAWLRSVNGLPETKHYDKIVASFGILIYRHTMAFEICNNKVLIEKILKRFKNHSKRDIIQLKKHYIKMFFSGEHAIRISKS